MTNTAFACGSSETIAPTLLDRLGESAAEASLVIFFGHVDLDGRAIGDALRSHFVGVPIIGCSANGAFSDQGFGQKGCAAIAVPRATAPRVVATLARLGDDVDAAVARAGADLSRALGRSVRELDFERHVGLMLVEGATQREERVNEAIGNIAPSLRFVGGSAGDDIKFSRTWAYCDGELAYDGCAFAVLEVAAPYGIIHCCNLRPSGTTVQVTRVEPGTRIIRELDGQPAARFFARLAGKEPAELTFVDFLERPLGLMIDDLPWLRSGVRVEGDGVLFACSVVEGATLDIMSPRELVADTREQIAQLEKNLAGPIDSAILFNCAYRMIEARLRGTEAAYHTALGAFSHAGMHTNGESYLGHINQTLTGLVFRKR